MIDKSFSPPKPLVSFLREFGDEISRPILESMKKYAGISSQSFPADDDYKEKVQFLETAFESSELYKKMADGSELALDEALDLIATNQVDVLLKSKQEDKKGWTYLHLMADLWKNDVSFRSPGKERRLIRLIYRLCLAGAEVNAISEGGETPLMKAFDINEPKLAIHFLRCGGDGGIPGPGGTFIGTERYEFQNRLVMKASLRAKDIAGIWAAVEAGDVKRTKQWLSSWCRVNAVRDERSVLDVARSLGDKEIIDLMVEYRHTTELVSTALACDSEKVMLLLALGRKMCNLNPIDPTHYIGLLEKRCRIETIPRPFIVTAIEICTPTIVAKLVKFGADLTHYYEEAAPCGPVAFWAFREGIDPAVTMVIAESAGLELYDERGCSLLHRALSKPENELKKEIVKLLIDRGIDISHRDIEGSTPRDYITILDLPDAEEFHNLIDHHILELTVKGKSDFLDNLLLQSYDHILSIRGPPKNRTITEHVTLKNLTDIKQFLDELPMIEKEIASLMEAAANGNIAVLARSIEKISIFGRDKGGRTILHHAVLWEQEKIINFIIGQKPQLLNLTDNLNRTALHYCAALPMASRRNLWPLLGHKHNGCNPAIVDVNNMTAADYVKEMDKETPLEMKR